MIFSIFSSYEINLFFYQLYFLGRIVRSRGNKPWVLGEIFLVLFLIYFRSGWQRNSFWFAWKQWKVHICSASGWCLQVLFLKSGKVFSLSASPLRSSKDESQITLAQNRRFVGKILFFSLFDLDSRPPWPNFCTLLLIFFFCTIYFYFLDDSKTVSLCFIHKRMIPFILQLL